MPESSQNRPRSRRGKRTKSRRRNLILGSSIFLVLLIAMVAWVGVRALMAKSELESAVPLATTLRNAVAKQDVALVSRTASALARHASAADNLTSDPIWRAAEIVPGLGPNLAAFRELASVTNDLSRDAVGPLTRLAATVDLSDLRPKDGAVNIEPLVVAAPMVSKASMALASADRRIQDIDTRQTLAAVSGAKEKLSKQVSSLSGPLAALDNAVRLLPTMLGGNESRDYVLVFQNPAEMRSTGGIPGAMALVNATDGRISLVAQASSADFAHFQQPVLSLPDDTRGLYGDLVGEYIQDTNLTPNFPLSAELIRAMWQQRFGQQVDGVISVDPVALSYLLDVTGPIPLPTGDVLQADNSVSLLLNEVYFRYPNPAQQDLFFAGAAKAVFESVSRGSNDPTKLIDALTRAGDERRLLIWSDHEPEQKLIAKTTLAGIPDPLKKDSLGIFFNDGTGAKMGYYLDTEVSIATASCRNDGRLNIGTSIELTNTAPIDAPLPGYVTGGGNYGVEPGTIRTIVSVYGNPSMTNLGVARDGEPVSAHSAVDNGMPVTQIPVDLSPGESVTLFFGFLSDVDGAYAGDFQITPLINMNETSELSLTCESALW